MHLFKEQLLENLKVGFGEDDLIYFNTECFLNYNEEGMEKVTKIFFEFSFLGSNISIKRLVPLFQTTLDNQTLEEIKNQFLDLTVPFKQAVIDIHNILNSGISYDLDNILSFVKMQNEKKFIVEKDNFMITLSLSNNPNEDFEFESFVYFQNNREQINFGVISNKLPNIAYLESKKYRLKKLLNKENKLLKEAI